MKKILGNKTAIILIVALLVGFGGTFAYLSMTDSTKKDEEKKEETKKEEDNNIQTEKGDGLPTQQASPPKQEPVQEGAPTGSTSLSTLNSSVTAQKNPSDESIAILFYIEGSGYFTSQEKSGGSWTTVKENQYYAGRGGFNGGSIPAGQEAKTMRVLKIENGKYVSVTKEFTVTRSEVEAALGIKTYN